MNPPVSPCFLLAWTSSPATLPLHAMPQAWSTLVEIRYMRPKLWPALTLGTQKSSTLGTDALLPDIRLYSLLYSVIVFT